MKFLGVTDDTTTCELCGKNNLKRTVVIEMEDGGIVHYGCDCAAKTLKKTVKGASVRDVNQIADVMAYAQKWLAIYDLAVVAKGVWNKYGFLSEVCGDTIKIKMAAAGYVEIKKQ